ncbi:Glycoside hydrolase, family 31 [Metarhizium rileyi]|uniref:alpha-glucosidase n=1 Tax=Metarhizium rileyi (strain RCEF 4871) TaxID=1649241 RepID=A0A167KCU0_METRR|nr:Glycoside hydrolase, family 31 [Metarhizium rileyi RCEF 4871]
MVRSQVRADTELTAQSSAYVGGRTGDKYRFTVLADGVLRYEWAPDGVFEDRPSAFAVQRAPKDLLSYRVRESQDSLEITTSRFHMTYDKQEFTPSGFFVVVPGYTGHTWRYGEQGQNLGGTCRTLDGVDGRTEVDAGVASRDGFASLDDSRSMLFTEDGFVAPRRAGTGRVDGYLFCYGRNYREAVRALYKISGPQPLLPRWTLGNWWSRYYEYSAESYLQLVEAFKTIRIPLSVGILDMDWHLVKDARVAAAGASGWTGYTWNRSLFPNPKAFIEALHERKLKTSLNEHPAEGIASYEDMYSAMAKALGFDTSNKDTIPFDCADPRFLKAYFDILIKHLEDTGTDFWWIDWQQGPYSRVSGLDPLWLLNHFHFLHNEQLQAGREPAADRDRGGGGRRPIIFSRYAGPGSQRYPVGFSGDTIVTWESLNFQPEFTATASNIGYGWWSHDIGGHMRGIRDDHLTSRWVQLGVFSPIMRLHSTKTRWVCKEPWRLPGGSGQGPQDVVAKFMRLRHRLIPYLHTMNARAADEGQPLVQPMYWEYPDREEAYKVPNQYLFGTEMMVAPITTPQNPSTRTGKVRAWLPPGRYVDLFTGVVYQGNRFLWLSRTLDNLPVLLRQGAIVPLDANPEPGNGCDNPDALEVVLVIGADGVFELMEEDDDEACRSRRPVVWHKTIISFTQETGTLTIHPGEAHRVPRARRWSIRLLGYRPDASPIIDVRVMTNPQQHLTLPPRNPLQDDSQRGLLIDVGEIPPGGNAIVKFGPDVELSTNDPLALADPIVFAAQIPYETKAAIDDILAPRGVSAAVRASQVDATDMDADLKLVLKELLLADDGGGGGRL